MEYFPLAHDLRNRLCLVVGAGLVAERKVELLRRAGARLLVVAPEASPGMLALAATGNPRLELRTYAETDLEGVHLVVAATDEPRVNAQVSRDAKVRCIPVNVVDSPELCTCVFPSIIDRSPVIVALSTSGRSPSLARWLREQIERLIPGRTGALAEFLAELKPRVRSALPDWQRRRFYEALLASPASEAVLAGQAERASELASRLLSDMQQGLQGRLGEVYLVGAGPGDPDLLTLRALRLMQQADVCLYDNLVSPPILEMVRRDARREYVGKRRNLHAMPQEAINDKLVRLAGEGLRVLRLKGGDPFVFGRGGEEIESLAEHGIPFQVVPGVTAANGCACYAGIPLTHRDYAQSVRFVTGQASAGAPPLPWSELAQPNQTLVVYMGLVRLAEICAQLISHGCPPTMPAALICRGTLPDQQVLVGSLESLPEQVVSAAVQAPTLLIVGEVVLLRTRLG